MNSFFEFIIIGYFLGLWLCFPSLISLQEEESASIQCRDLKSESWEKEVEIVKIEAKWSFEKPLKKLAHPRLHKFKKSLLTTMASEVKKV